MLPIENATGKNMVVSAGPVGIVDDARAGVSAGSTHWSAGEKCKTVSAQGRRLRKTSVAQAAIGKS